MGKPRNIVTVKYPYLLSMLFVGILVANGYDSLGQCDSIIYAWGKCPYSKQIENFVIENKVQNATWILFSG